MPSWSSRDNITNSDSGQNSSAQHEVSDGSRDKYSLSDVENDDQLGTAQLKHEIRTYKRAKKRKGDDDSAQLSLSLTKRLRTQRISSDSA